VGQVTSLRTLHDRLDEAVAAAYGWPVGLSDAEILARLVTLNTERRAEEENGLVRWLRPEYQAPLLGTPGVQRGLAIEDGDATEARPWPKRQPEQFVALRAAVAGRPATPATPADVARQFVKAPRGRLKEMLEALVAMGQARQIEGGRFVA
jgi:hypothetical protein